MVEIVNVLTRMEILETELRDIRKFWYASVDDIKATIKAEIKELKTEQLADLKDTLRERELQIQALDLRLRKVETAIHTYEYHSRILQWTVTIIIGIASGVAGFFGARIKP